MSYNPDLRKWAMRPLRSDATPEEARSHHDVNHMLKLGNALHSMELTRGHYLISRKSAVLLVACLFGAGFTTAIWIAALIRS